MFWEKASFAWVGLLGFMRAAVGSAIILCALTGVAEAQFEWRSGFHFPDGNGVNNNVRVLTVFDDGTGPALYAGGEFTMAGGVPANSIAKWTGTAWAPLGGGLSAFGPLALTGFDDGTGPALYAGGHFIEADGVAVNKIAKWNGTAWAPLGSGMNAAVFALTVFDDGTGPALYAGGGFTMAGGVPVNFIAKWTGTAWEPVGGGVDAGVKALTVFDGALYAGGAFFHAGGVDALRVAKWDGTAWAPLGNGLDATPNALTVFDAALYAGGDFNPGGVAKWTGTAWEPLGSGVNCCGVSALTVFDECSGLYPALYAGGGFDMAGGVPANRVAKWTGTAWEPLGSGLEVGDGAFALSGFDDGTGPALYAGGRFFIAGGVPSAFIGKWAAQ